MLSLFTPASLALLPGAAGVGRSMASHPVVTMLAGRDIGLASVPATMAVAVTSCPMPAIADSCPAIGCPDQGFDLVGSIVNLGLSAILLAAFACARRFRSRELRITP